MSGIVIQAENLGKHYPTGHQAENGRYVALRAQGRALRDPARRNRGHRLSSQADRAGAHLSE